MRKITAILITACLLASLAGCGSQETPASTTADNSTTSTAGETSSTSSTPSGYYVDESGDIIDASTGEKKDNVKVDEETGDIIDTNTGEVIQSKDETDKIKEEISKPTNPPTSSASSKPASGNTSRPTTPPTSSNNKPTEPPKDTTPPTTTPDDPKHTHKWEYYYTISGPFCDRDGVNAEKCFACGETREVPNKERAPHSFDSWVNEKIATPTETGLKTRKCFNCGYKEKKTVAKVNWNPSDKNQSLEMWKLTNEERQKNGSGTLKYRYDLQAYADQRAKETFTLFEHKRPDGRSWDTVYTDGGLELMGAIGENCARARNNAKDIIEDLMASPWGHRENLLDKDYTGVVIGVYWHEDEDGNMEMWTAHLYVTDELG